MPSFPFPMKSKRFKIILLAFHLGLLAAVIGCATRSEAPATEGPATPRQPEEGWAFAGPQRRDATASQAETAATATPVEAPAPVSPAEIADAPEAADAGIIRGENGPTPLWLPSSPFDELVELARKFAETNPETAKALFSREILDSVSATTPPEASPDEGAETPVAEAPAPDEAAVSGKGSGEAEPSPVVVPAPAAPAPIPWRTPTYSLVARSMDLRQALETFGAAQGIATVLSPTVAGAFSGEFLDTPCDEFLDRLAALHNLSWYWDGASLFVYGPGETQTILIDLRYMKAGEVRAMLAELGVEDPRFPLKTASDDELIMVSGPPRYVTLVAEMISKADKLRENRTFTEVETRLFPLENTWADDVSFSASSPESNGSIKGVASMLKDIVGKIAAPDARESGSTNAPSSFQPLITAENRLNAVVVTDVAHRMPLYERLIRELDVPQQLIEIAVTVVELSRNDALDWQLSLGVDFAKGHSNVGVGQNAGNLFGTDAISGRGLAGALTRLGTHYNLSASLTALRDSGKARSISRTALLTVNNLAVELTDTQSYHARVVGTEVATLETVSAGTTLQVKPRIMKKGSADLPARLWLTLSLDDGGFESVSVDSMPMTRTSTLNTQTSIYEGETLMLAGYFRDVDHDARWGIPWLRDIPLIGWIFGGYTTQTETVQRLFLITPVIVDIDAEDLARIQATRLRDVRDMEDLFEDADDDAEESEIRDLEHQERRERRRQDLERRLKDRRERIKAIRNGKDPDASTTIP